MSRRDRAVPRLRILVLSALLAVGLAAVATPAPAHATTSCGTPAGAYPWCDTALSPDQRADLLLAALTGPEKISLLAGIATTTYTGQTQNIDRVGLRSVNITDDGVGVKRSGPSTALPIPLAIAATFDTTMASAAGTTIADETKAKGDDIILGPTVNIMRTPLGGRTFEAYGEDPYLQARTAVSWIDSAQAQGVMAEVKHFCCNNEEGAATLVCEKNFCSSDLDERTLREVYTPQFEAAVKEANAAAVMCAYNRVNDDWACEHQHLLSGILKGEWAFPGIVMSDWQSQHFTVQALKNGLDVEMPTASDYSPTNVNAALTAGLVTWADIDDHVHRFLRTLFAFGFFDRAPYVADDALINVAAHDHVAQQIEESGMTLLKNAGVLPLDSRTRSIALIGPQADRFEDGAGTEDITPFTYSTPRQAITQRAGAGVTVTYDDGSNSTTAAATAAAADVAVVFASDHEGEYNDKTSPSVDGSNGSTTNQDGLISTVAAANPNTIVVLETGDPVTTPWRDSVKGIVEAWYPGQAGGTALARVLYGDVDPGGRLPVTFPGSATAYPTAGDPAAYPGVGTDVLYTEGVFVGYRWYDQNNVTPAYPFGYGLSYTTFSYHDLSIQQAPPGSGSVATVSVEVTNTGGRTGSAVPELYLGLPSPSATVLQPPRQLRGYSKLALAAGQTQTVSFPLDDRAFSFWDVGSNGWVVAPGCYGVMAGSSSRDLPLQGTISRGGAACGPGSVMISDAPPAAVAEAPLPGLLASLGALAGCGWAVLARRRRRRLGTAA